MNIETAAKIACDKLGNSVAIGGFKVNGGWVVALKPKNWKGGTLMDPYFKVTEGKIVTEYSPVMDPKEFREGLKSWIKLSD